MMYVASLIWAGLGLYNVIFLGDIEIGLTFFILQMLTLITVELQKINDKDK